MRLVVIAPGRGSYNRTELGYLRRHGDHPRFGERARVAATIDAGRTHSGRMPVSELDDAPGYNPKIHLPGENASSLIFACAAADLALIDPEHEIVATCGNSMGWYIALCAGGALDLEQAFHLIDTMGGFQQDNIIGGQLIYPVVDDDWCPMPERLEGMEAALERVRGRGEDHWVGLSILLGGLRVLAGTAIGIRALLDELPPVKLGANDYPFQLPRHSAFHTDLMAETSRKALYALHRLHWQAPRTPLIDGNGWIWHPYQTDLEALRDYTLIDQVLEPYDFTASLRVAIREYNPDHLVLLGPGETLGGAIAHVIIAEGWRGIDGREAFIAAQKSDRPPLIAMNRPDQARHII